MVIPRFIESSIVDDLKTTKKGLILYGARQVGKTTLINEIIKKLNFHTFFINGDQSQYIDIISSRNLDKIKKLIKGYQLLFIDEAQRIPEIGLNIKIILDSIPGTRVIATGYSSLVLTSIISD